MNKYIIAERLQKILEDFELEFFVDLKKVYKGQTLADRILDLIYLIDKEPKKRGEGFGNENLNRLKTFLMEKYPIKGLDGIADRRALFNLMQVCNPRKGQDEWMNPDWKENFKSWYRTYAESMQGKEEFMVRSVRALKDKIKDWRERGGK